MVAATRTQLRYDHRLPDLVQTTGDIEHATRHGVPRSTARGWLSRPRTEVISIDVVDADALAMQEQVIGLRQRVDGLMAILRLVVVMLKVSAYSLERTRLPDGRGKLM